MASTGFSNYEISALTYEQPKYTVSSLYYQPMSYVGGVATAAPTVVAQPTAPASPAASASDLQILIASIPTAHDGQVITADYHNALRLALVAIANRMGLGPVSDEITVTVAPAFDAGSSSTAWTAEYGLAVQGGATSGAIKGWAEADLPDGARIKKVIAYATATTVTGDGTLKVRLLRQKITDSTVQVVLAEVVVPAAADLTKGVEADVTLPGTGAGVTAIEEFRVVDNRQHKYLLTAEISDVTKVTGAKITAIQIILGR